MKNSVLPLVQSLERDYGTVNNVQNDIRLTELHVWWDEHPDDKKVHVYKIYRDGEYLTTGTAKEIADEIGFMSTSVIYGFNSKIYKAMKHNVKYELVEVE